MHYQTKDFAYKNYSLSIHSYTYLNKISISSSVCLVNKERIIIRFKCEVTKSVCLMNGMASKAFA